MHMEKSRTTSEVYLSLFEDILKNSDKKEYGKCAELCTDFIKFAWRLRENREIFVGEILESIFYQLADELETSKSSDDKNVSEYKSKIYEQMLHLLQEVIESYTNGDQNELYKSLTKIRVNVTDFQFKLSQLGGQNGK